MNLKKINQKEICQNLNTLDQVGFLDYDPSTYVFTDEPALLGGGSTTISVSAWKSAYISFDSLGAYIGLQLQASSTVNGLPVILPALRNAFIFLDEYPIYGFEVYHPKKFGVWVMPAYDTQDPPSNINGVLVGEWPLKSSSLSNLYSGNKSLFTNENPIRYMTVAAEDGNKLYSYLSESFDDGDTYYEIQKDGSKKYFYVFIRPLLSYEKSDASQTDFSAKNFETPIAKLSCDPSDGVLPIPTLSNP